ncbi:YeeE/YedE family protein [Pseudoduganella sp. UC29_106]|uniref:YeeE/YedE family protein n=1 Tax=Pseudoduganella sp. UC29_106 TaxID=3374553 RepID=UPI003756C6FE
MSNFTPWTSLAGGILIGLSATVLILMNGRVAGVSGIVGGLLVPRKGDVSWRLAFLAGLIGAPLVYALFLPLPEVRVAAGPAGLVAAGLLVGIGTRYGSGCTSGHGVCGVSRMSPRSLVATAAFMLAGFATVFVLRHLIA